MMCLQNKIILKAFFWKVMQDDVFLGKKEMQLLIDRWVMRFGFLWKLNGYKNRKPFSMEIEKEGVMPFLEMLIKWEKIL